MPLVLRFDYFDLNLIFSESLLQYEQISGRFSSFLHNSLGLLWILSELNIQMLRRLLLFWLFLQLPSYQLQGLILVFHNSRWVLCSTAILELIYRSWQIFSNLEHNMVRQHIALRFII